LRAQELTKTKHKKEKMLKELGRLKHNRLQLKVTIKTNRMKAVKANTIY